jgi:hypothetical protein
MYANVTDIASSIDAVFLEINSINYTCTNDTASNFSHTISDLGVNSYNYYFYANDTQGNLQKSSQGTLVISQATGTATLGLNPSNSITYGTTITATCDVNNAEVSPVLYRDNIDVTAAENNSAITLGATTYDYECNFTATQNYTTSSHQNTLTVSKASTTTTVYLNGTASDNSIEYGDVNITIILDLAGKTVKYYRNSSLMQSATTPLENISSWTTLGDYNITGIFEGEANYSSSQTDLTLTIEDTQSPTSVSISSPNDNDYLNTAPTISGTWSDDYKDTCYTNTTEYGGTSSTFSFTNTSALSDQRYDILVTCNDTSGNTDTDLVYFYFDETNPVITISSPKNITYDTNTIWMNVTLDETGSWCGYSFDGAANDTMTEGANDLWYGKEIELGETSHNVKIWCNDSYGNMKSTSLVYLTVDVTAPSINYISPSVADNGYTNNDYYTINTTITDTNDITSILDWNHSLVAWYQFKNDTDFSDQSGNGNDGTEHSVSHNIDGKFGGALSLSGTGYIEINSTASYVSGDTLTWECWIKTSETTNDNVIGGWNTNTGDNRLWFDSVQSNNLKIYDNTWHDTGATVNDNNWHYIVVTYDATDVVVYVDKIKKLTYQNSINFASNDRVSIGQEWDADTTSGEFIGLIDDVRIWNRTLSYEEINATYDTKTSRMYATFTGLEDIAYNYKVYAQDVAGNVGKTTLYTINIDTLTPTFSDYARNPDPPHEDQNVEVNVTISETPSTVILEWNGTTNYTVTTNNALEYYFTMINGASNYTAHDTITYYWYATDAAGNTGKSAQQSFTVSNQAPTTPTTLTLTTPIKVTETLTASGSGSTDADAEDSLTYYYEFYNTNSSTIIQAYNTDNTYVIQQSDAHDKIRVRTKAHDGYVYSSEKETNRTISDTLPTTPSGSSLTATVKVTETLTSTGAGSTDADGDSVTYHHQFYNTNNTVERQAKSSDNTYVIQVADAHDRIRVRIWAHTDLGDSANYEEELRDITDTVPTLPSTVSFNDTTLYTNDDVLCTGSGSTDTDDDSITYYYKFNDSGATLQDWSTANTFDCETAGCDKNNNLNCYVKAFTDLANSTTNSTSTTILNTVPTIPTSLILNDSTLYTNDDVIITGSGSSDADSDGITYYYKFNDTGGTLQDWSTTATFDCETNGCDKLETLSVWTKAVTSDANSSALSNSTTILNTAPVIEFQNTFTNSSTGHEFDVVGGITDADGYSDIIHTNISSSSGSCSNTANATSGTYFNSTWHCTGTAYISTDIIIGFTDDSDAYISTTLSSNNYPNHLPSIISVDATPNSPITTDDLICTVTGWSDDDSDGADYYYEWYNSTTLMLTIHSSSTTHTLLAGNTSNGESWNCTVIPYDGYDNGTALSDVVTIGDIAPEMTTPSLSPATIYTNINIEATSTYSDIDASPGTVYFKWYVDNVETFTDTFTNVANNTAKTSTFNSGNYTKDQDINCSVYSNDGSSNSETKWSSTKTVQNSAPTIEYQNTFVNASAGHSFNVTAGIIDLDGYSDITLTNISSGNCVNLVNSSTGNYFNSTWNCTGTAFQSENIIIGFMDASDSYVHTTQSSNSYPDQTPSDPSDITGFPANLYVGNTLTVSATGSSDADGDAITHHFKFYNVEDANTVQDWSSDTSYTIQVSDAHNTIRVYAKSTTTYANSTGSYSEDDSVDDTVPTIPTALILNDTTLYTNDDVSVAGSGSTDTDGDSITYYYMFNDTGGTLQDWSTNTIFDCETAGCDKSDTLSAWTKAVTSYGNSSVLSNSTTILNTAPSIPTTLILNDSTLYTNDDVNMSASGSSDVDGDSIEYYFKFNKTGQTLQDWSTTSVFSCSTANCDKNDALNIWVKAVTSDANSSTISNSTTILNSIPSDPTDITGFPTSLYVTNTLSLSASGGVDDDGDSITYYFKYYNENDSTIRLDWNNSGYTIQQVDAHDNMTIYSKSVTDDANSTGSYYENDFVDDTFPTTPTDVIINDSTVYTNDHFQWDASSSTDADGDSITYYYKINKTSHIFQNYSTTNILSCAVSGCDKTNVIYVWVLASTTLANSSSLSNSTTILNSLPTLPSSWTDLGNRLTDHTPHVTFTEGSDDDGDTVTSVAYTGITSTPTQQDVGSTNEYLDLGQDVTLNDGTTYYYRFRSWDGYEYSSSYTSSDEFHMNDEPTTGVPTIIPGTIYSTTSEIMCENTTTTDPDSDAITFHYEWYKNDISLSLNLKNITNTNYTAGDAMICEIWVSDPYETNTTKQNSSSITVEGYTPVINLNYTYLSDNSIDMTPAYGETIKINANVTDTDSDLEGVYFTLLAPNGTYIFNSINGTNYNTDLWNSSTHTLDAYGSWLVNITANDSLSLSSSEQWNFTVNLGDLSYLPTSKSYSQKASETESFNVTFNHDGNSNNTINMTAYGDISDASKFTINYFNAVTNVNITNENFTVEEGSDYILKINISSDVAVVSGVYTGNITFERIEDNAKSNMSMSVTVSALSGNVILTPEAWAISMDSASSSSTTFNIENDGDYNLTHCNGSISTWSSYDSYNSTDFSIAQSSSKDVLVTLSNIPAGTYTKEVVFSCISTPNNGIDTDASTISATITQYTEPPTPEYGGGGGDAAEAVECWSNDDCIDKFGYSKPYCINGTCEVEPEFIECWTDEECEILFPGTKEYCINHYCAMESEVECWSDDDCRSQFGFDKPFCTNHKCSISLAPIPFSIFPKEVNISSIIGDIEKQTIIIHNHGTKPIQVSLSISGEKAQWVSLIASNFSWLLHPMSERNVYLEVLIRQGSQDEQVILTFKAVEVDDEYRTSEKQVSMYISSIDGKEIGVLCDSNSECLSKNCLEGKCVPFGAMPAKPKRESWLVIVGLVGLVGVIGIIGYMKKKDVVGVLSKKENPLSKLIKEHVKR